MAIGLGKFDCGTVIGQGIGPLFEQIADDVQMAAFGRKGQRAMFAGADGYPLIDEEANHLQASIARGHEQGAALLRVQRHAAVRQVAQYGLLAFGCGNDRHGAIPRQQVGAMPVKETQHLEMAVLRRHAGGIFAFGADIAASQDELAHHIEMALFRSEPEGAAVFDSWVGALIEQPEHHREMALLRRQAKGFLIACGDVGSSVHQRAHGAQVAVGGRACQCVVELLVQNFTKAGLNAVIACGGPARDKAPMAAPDVWLTKLLSGP